MSRENLIFYKIENHPSYGVNKLGLIINYSKRKILKPVKDKKNYLWVKLNGKKYLISRIVAKTFLDGFDENLNVTYKDGDRTNVHLDNLIQKTHKDLYTRF